ncbi:MAG: rhomboid family intramembrane serine protease [Opitutaceae bacterium]
MLSDRTYMRDNYPRERASVLAWLISAIVAAFVLQFVFERLLEMPGALEHFFGLSASGVKAGRIWLLLTYGFLHDTNNILQIVGNLLGLYFLGRVLLPLLGVKRFLSLYGATVVMGGIAWTATHWQTGGMLVGSTAGIAGLFMVYACFYPNQPVTFLLFFIVPVTLKPKYVAMAWAAFALAGCLAYEIFQLPAPFNIAFSAHLGGLTVGWIYYRYLHDVNWHFPTRRANIELPRWLKKSAQSPAPAVYQVNVGKPGNLRAEVDRILDKINSEGFGALTADEKRVLDGAKDILTRG